MRRWAVTALAVCAMWPQPAHASERLRPINEGGDYQHCVTYDEAMAVFVGMPMHRVQRVVDTDGRRAGRAQLDYILGNVAGVQVRRSSLIRSYPACDTLGQSLIAEFSTKPRHRLISLVFGA